MTIIEMKQF